MPSAYANFRLPDGKVVRVPAAGIIGRMSTAHLRILDPEVSEAHALVSLRGRNLKLVALRGALEVDGKSRAEVLLRMEQKIRLSASTVVEVVGVNVPSAVLALSGVVDGPVLLEHGVLSLVEGPRVEQGMQREAHVLFWSEGDGWIAREAEGAAVSVALGQEWRVGGTTVKVVLVEASENTTRQSKMLPITIVIAGEVTTVSAAGRGALRLAGMQAALLGILAQSGSSLHWEAIAAQFWRQKDREQWRERFDALVKEVRGKFRDAGIRGDLIWSWAGEYRLNLGEADVVEVKGE